MISASPPASAVFDGKLAAPDFSAPDTAAEALARKPRSWVPPKAPLKAPFNATLLTSVETPSSGESCAPEGVSPTPWSVPFGKPGRIVDLSPDMSQNPQQTNHL